MKRSISLVLALLLTACSSWPEYDGYVGQEHLLIESDTMRIYDENGNLVGSIDERSKMVFDRDGNFIGRIQK